MCGKMNIHYYHKLPAISMWTLGDSMAFHWRIAGFSPQISGNSELVHRLPRSRWGKDVELSHLATTVTSRGLNVSQNGRGEIPARTIDGINGMTFWTHCFVFSHWARRRRVIWFWKWQPLAATRVTASGRKWPQVAASILLSPAATCSLLQPLEWPQVAASGRLTSSHGNFSKFSAANPRKLCHIFRG